MKHIHFKTINSTNTYLLDHIDEHDHLTIISASEQTHGMGRMARPWYGNDQSLMCSILLKENIDTLNITLLPLLMAKSCHQVLVKYHSNIKIKWPNDLMINDKKLAGILVKTKTIDHKILAVVVGLGVNVNHMIFDDLLTHMATSLYLETNKTYDIAVLMREIFEQFSYDLITLNDHSKMLVDYCNEHAYLNGHTVHFSFNHHTRVGVASHVNIDGKLVIHSESKTYEIYCDDIIKEHKCIS